jgi:hypothetical protein
LHRLPVHLLVVALALIGAACDDGRAKSAHTSVTVRLPPARSATAAPGFSKNLDDGQDVLAERSTDGNHPL